MTTELERIVSCSEPISEDRLSALGFTKICHGDCPPYESWKKNDIEVWEFNGRYWLVDALDQAGIDVEFRTLGQLELFFLACQKSLYS